jgi:hypothetical protein
MPTPALKKDDSGERLNKEGSKAFFFCGAFGFICYIHPLSMARTGRTEAIYR